MMGGGSHEGTQEGDAEHQHKSHEYNDGETSAIEESNISAVSSTCLADKEELVPAPRRSTRKSCKKDEELQELIFPKRLMAIISDPTNDECIRWCSDGSSFFIIDKDMFASKIMPKLSTRQAKFSSFVRKLNRWGFSFVTKGPAAGHYRHDYFHRDKPFLVSQMYYHNSRAKEALKEEPQSASISEGKPSHALDSLVTITSPPIIRDNKKTTTGEAGETTGDYAIMSGCYSNHPALAQSPLSSEQQLNQLQPETAITVQNNTMPHERANEDDDQVDRVQQALNDQSNRPLNLHDFLQLQQKASGFIDAKNAAISSDGSFGWYAQGSRASTLVAPRQARSAQSRTVLTGRVEGPAGTVERDSSLVPLLEELFRLRSPLFNQTRMGIPQQQRTINFPSSMATSTSHVDHVPFQILAARPHSEDQLAQLNQQRRLDARLQQMLSDLQGPMWQTAQHHLLSERSLHNSVNPTRLTNSPTGAILGINVPMLQHSMGLQGTFDSVRGSTYMLGERSLSQGDPPSFLPPPATLQGLNTRNTQLSYSSTLGDDEGRLSQTQKIDDDVQNSKFT